MNKQEMQEKVDTINMVGTISEAIHREPSEQGMIHGCKNLNYTELDRCYEALKFAMDNGRMRCQYNMDILTKLELLMKIEYERVIDDTPTTCAR